MKFSVFTVTTPDYTVDEILDKLQQFGYDGVEWRVTEPFDPTIPIPPRAQHYHKYNKCTVNVHTLAAEALALRRKCEDRALEIVNLATYSSTKDFDVLKQIMAVAPTIGCRNVRVGVPHYKGDIPYRQLLETTVREIEALVPFARQFGVRMVFEVHHRTIIPSCSAAYRLVSAFDPDVVGVIHDAGNMVCEGYESWQLGLDILGPYLSHVHIKNASWTLDAVMEDGTSVYQSRMVPLRVGHVNYRDLLKILINRGYDGYLSFEDFSLEQTTEEKLQANIQYMKGIIAELQADSVMQG